MSQWTHINGVIRIDSLRGIGTKLPFSTEGKIRDLMGPIVKYRDSEKQWNICEEAGTPMGSEGSLQYHIWENPDECCLASFDVIITGDLRDYGLEDIDKVEKWFKRIVNTKDLMIRSAVLEINVGGGPTILLRADNEGELYRFDVIGKEENKI